MGKKGGDNNNNNNNNNNKNRAPALAIRVHLPFGWNTYLLFNTDIVHFVWKTDEEEAESVVLLVFVFWQCLNRR